ncbi:cytochrome C [Arcticibacter tournemirensis]|uniref:Cytochrome C n=2 Tax=Arcticibacter tournemirensis TaxID=699437 RepID=A0A4V1KI58_9SPHI|nr:cytochrome C [Arcticibacter tournemirensis]
MMKKILYVIIGLFLVIQFIRPEENRGDSGGPHALQNVVDVPDTVLAVLKISCYDCHSNTTVYPWYTNVQPVGWWLANHVSEGKRELNFDEFKTYPSKKAIHKLEETADVIKENEMPLNSYLLIHRTAKLTEAQKQMVIDWAQQAQMQVK